MIQACGRTSTRGYSRNWMLLLLVAACWLASPAPWARAADASRPIQLVVLGDSLSAGHQLAATDAFPVKLERALRAKGLNVRVANAGVSGDTASDALARVDWSVPDGTDAVIVELGGNDALRGIDPAVTRKALKTLIEHLKQRRIAVLLCGMLAPRNLGEAYDRAFDAIYPELAAAEQVPLYPFFLDGVAADPSLNLADGMHPTPAGVDVIVARILPAVEKLLAHIKPGSSS